MATTSGGGSLILCEGRKAVLRVVEYENRGLLPAPADGSGRHVRAWVVLNEPAVPFEVPVRSAQRAPQGIKVLRCNQGRAVDMNQPVENRSRTEIRGRTGGEIYTAAPVVGLGAPSCTAIEVTACDLAAHSAVAP